MPYFACAATVTAPPAAPLLPAELVADECVADELGALAVVDAGARLAGTTVAPVPSSTSTCPAASDVSDVAVAPK